MIEFDDYRLRLLRPEDAGSLFDLIESNRDRLIEFLPITCQENETQSATRQYIEQRENDARQRRNFTLIIEDMKGGQFVGLAIIKKLDWHAKDCELGYFVDRNCEGKGIATKAVSAVVEHCFQKLRLDKIGIIVADYNKGSVAVAAKNGFSRVGTLIEGHTDHHGNKIDVDRYEIRAKEF